jgi:hypothetical protein
VSQSGWKSSGHLLSNSAVPHDAGEFNEMTLWPRRGK